MTFATTLNIWPTDMVLWDVVRGVGHVGAIVCVCVFVCVCVCVCELVGASARVCVSRFFRLPTPTAAIHLGIKTRYILNKSDKTNDDAPFARRPIKDIEADMQLDVLIRLIHLL